MPNAPDESPSPQQNLILERLSASELERIQPHLQFTRLPLGHVLYEPGDVLPYVYFPTAGIISLLYVMEDGASAEISVVGNEGLIGVSLLMGGGVDAQPRGCPECRRRVSLE